MKKRNKNGAVAVYALLSITIFIAIVFLVFIVVNSKHKNQLRTAEDIKRDAEQYIADNEIEVIENPKEIRIYDIKHLDLKASNTYVYIAEENKIFKFTPTAEYIVFPKEPAYTLPETLNGANSPDISGFKTKNTYYVTWNTSSSPYEINESTKISQEPPTGWSNYTEGVNKWANIKTTGGENVCYWVWIPRYAYKVPTANTNVAETIDIKFLSGTSNIPIGESSAITNTTPAVGSWVVHPAFTNAGNGGFGELRGIWVAKYEASSSTVSDITFSGSTLSGDVASLNSNGGGAYNNQQIRVKPNVTSWREINVNDIFTVCRNMTDPKANNTNSSLVGTTGIDSHMMKNTEWGAVAYLSMSKYGKNSRVWNNSYYKDGYYSPITGLAGDDEYTPVISTKTMHQYNTEIGKNASTTGNVYGVYDMAGGADEYTAGYLSEESPNSDYTKLAEAKDKYKDKYAGTSSNSSQNYTANSDKYGDAVYETSSSGSSTGSWYGTNSYFPGSGYPIFIRGGHAYDGGYAGVFAFSYNDGYSIHDYSFRPALVFDHFNP